MADDADLAAARRPSVRRGELRIYVRPSMPASNAPASFFPARRGQRGQRGVGG